MVAPYANSSEVSYTTTLSYTLDTILASLEKASESLRVVLLNPSVWQESGPTKVHQTKSQKKKSLKSSQKN